MVLVSFLLLAKANIANRRCRKVPFSIEACTGTTYDVTKMQPQLFVCKSFEELTDALETFSKTMAFKTGGKEGLEKAIHSENYATAELNSGLQITGTFSETIENDAGELIYMRTNSPTALALHNKQLANHSTSVHSDGFGTPIGLLTENIALENCTDEQLQSLGITIGTIAEFTFASGIHVKGTVTDIVKTIRKLLLFPLSIAQLLITPAFYLMLHGAHLIWLLAHKSLQYSQVPQMQQHFSQWMKKFKKFLLHLY